MYQRFTDRARKVMALANQEAQRLNHEYLGTEHILLGLVKEGSGVGATVLRNLGMDIKRLRGEVEKLVKSGPEMVTIGKLPMTPRAKRAIECAMEEAVALNHNYVGTEHLLLGLLREREGVACQMLMNLGFTLEGVRGEVLTLLGAGLEGEPSESGTPSEAGALRQVAANYQDSPAWQKANELAQQVYDLAGQCPKEEIPGVAARLRATALSIPPQIAEAYVRPVAGEARWLLNSAFRSLRELRYLLEFAGRLQCLRAEDCERLEGLADEVDRLLRTLYRDLSV